MATTTVTDAEVLKLLKKYKDKAGKTSVNELKRLAQRYGITRPRGSGGKDALKKLARQIAEFEKKNAMRLMQVKRSAEQAKILKEQRRLRKLKLAKNLKRLKPLGTVAKFGGKATPWGKAIYEGGVALAQFSPTERAKSVEKFRDAGWKPFGLDPDPRVSAVIGLDRAGGEGVMTVGKGLFNPVQAVSGYYQAHGTVAKELQELIEQADRPTRSPAQIKADTDYDGKISDEERAAALKDRVPMLGGESVLAMRKGREAAAAAKYLVDVPAELRPVGHDKWFYGGAGDTEFEDAELGALFGRIEKQLGREEGEIPALRKELLEEQRKGTIDAKKREEELGEKSVTGKGVEYAPATEEYFGPDDRAAFRKAALDGTLVEMFDTDDSGSLSSKERALYFDKTRGFKAGGPIAAREAAAAKVASDLIPAPEPELEMVTDPVSGAEYPAEAGSMPPVDPREAPYGVDPDTGDPYLIPESPPTTLDYATMMRHEIETATDMGERNDTMRAIRESMVDQGLTTENEFNRIGRQMLKEAPARKAAAHVAYLRSPEGSDWVDTPGLDALAALQDARFGTGTALRGSVGGLKDPSRQLESIGGRQRRKARELEGMGHRSVAAQIRAGAPRRPLMSQRDRLKLEAKRRREEEQRQITAEGERIIKENTT